jgi:hypothetical protein
MEEAEMRRLTQRFRLLLVYLGMMFTVYVAPVFFSELPTPSLFATEISLVFGIALTGRVLSKQPRFLVAPPEPFFDVKMAVEEFRHKPLPWERK